MSKFSLGSCGSDGMSFMGLRLLLPIKKLISKKLTWVKLADTGQFHVNFGDFMRKKSA